jgi:hypothetical protein
VEPTRRRFALRKKLLMIPAAVDLAGLAITLPVSMSSTGHAAGPLAAPPGRKAAHWSGAATSGGRHVTYSATDWPGQFEAKVTLTYTGKTAIDGWKLTFTSPGDEAISSAWDATLTQTATA